MSDKSKTDITKKIIHGGIVTLFLLLFIAATYFSFRVFTNNFVWNPLFFTHDFKWNDFIRDESHKWYEFGSFYSGILMPILTLANVVVLYLLQRAASNFSKEKQDVIVKGEIFNSFVAKMEEETDKYILWTKVRKYDEMTTVLFRAQYKIENFIFGINSLDEMMLSKDAKTEIVEKCLKLGDTVDGLLSIAKKRQIPSDFCIGRFLDTQKETIKILQKYRFHPKNFKNKKL